MPGSTQIDKQNLSTPATVLTIVGFNLIMLMLLELPLLGFVVAPDWTPGAVERSKAWVSRNGHKAAVIALTVLGTALVIKGIVGLVS